MPEPGLGVPDTHLGTTFPNPLDPPAGCPFHPRCPEALPRCAAEPPKPIQSEESTVECHLYAA
ncbi:MAG TPA: oligopeptide/dipeptide ABC transporter ATP-binding protein [Stellaceae bacterium]|nr:oligopeptide/dipeptide ABC transporter ATP-binding protein [Stellaceae bacterium]